MTAKTDKIRKLLAAGHSTKEIVALAKCKPQQVYQTRYLEKRKAYKIQTKPSIWEMIKQIFRG